MPKLPIDKSRINKPRLQKAIAALRSEKYEQCIEVLKDGCEFCVLGVLADVSDLGSWEMSREMDENNGYLSEVYAIHPKNATYSTECAETILSRSLKKYYGFDRRCPVVEVEGETKSLVDLNDELYVTPEGHRESRYSFPEIADLLEQTYIN